MNEWSVGRHSAPNAPDALDSTSMRKQCKADRDTKRFRHKPRPTSRSLVFILPALAMKHIVEDIFSPSLREQIARMWLRHLVPKSEGHPHHQSSLRPSILCKDYIYQMA